MRSNDCRGPQGMRRNCEQIARAELFARQWHRGRARGGSEAPETKRRGQVVDEDALRKCLQDLGVPETA